MTMYRAFSVAFLTLGGLLAPACLPFEAAAQGVPAVASYELDVSFYPEEGRMDGRAEVSFAEASTVQDELIFYLHGELKVESIKCAGSEVSFAHETAYYRRDYSLVATKVTLSLVEQGLAGPLTIKYSGYFHPSKARSQSDYMRIDPTGVYLRSFGYSLWFPVFLEANRDGYNVDFSNVTVHTPREFVSVFAGERLSDVVSGDERISTWRAADLPLFAAQCTAHRFVVHREGNYIIYSWEDEKSVDAAPKISEFTARLNELYAARYRRGVTTGQLHVVQMPKYGDISSGNVVGLSTETWQDFEDVQYEKLTLAHELVHPFVQIPTPNGDPMRALVIEGFPSYFHLPILSEILGSDFYEDILDWVEEGYIKKKSTGQDRRGRTLPTEKPLTSIAADEIGVYKDQFVLADRALLFLDYLRRTMGRSTFDDYAKELFDRSSVDVDSFVQLTQKYYPGDDEDVRTWLETNEYPDRFKRNR